MLLYQRLEALHILRKDIVRIIFSNVNKGYYTSTNPDVWFDIAKYTSDSSDTSDPEDGVRSYHSRHRWLECLILPSDPDNSGEVSEDFHEACVEFELRPGEFIEHVDRFSELLKARDLCKQLLKYLGQETNEEKRDKRVSFWIELQVQIRAIMQPPRYSVTAIAEKTYDSESFDRVVQSLQKYRHSSPKEPYSSASIQLQRFLEQSVDDKESKKKYTSN